MATQNYREFDLLAGEGVVMQLPSGQVLSMRVIAVGVDLQGERVVELDLRSANNDDLVVSLTNNDPLRINLLDDEGLPFPARLGESRTSSSELQCHGWLRIWYFLRLLLSKSTRETVFMPWLHELNEDLTCDRSMAFSKHEKLFVNFAFAMRTAKALAECIYIDFSTSPVPWKWILASLTGALVAKIGLLTLR